MNALVNHQPNQIDLSKQESRKKLATLAMRLFDKWDLSSSEQLGLLGLSPTSRKVLSDYRKGNALPNSRDMLDRIGWILSIHKALKLLYPKNENIRYSWVKRRNQLLNNQRPIDIMQEQGIIGIAKVSRYLDHLRGF